MTKKRMLADVLWEAANVHLPAHLTIDNPCKWSCNAALAAEFGGRFHYEFSQGKRCIAQMRDESKTGRFLESLGADPSIDSGISQGVRYMWLLLAMHVAEDEGIEV
jgi:hypothetical protein